MSEYCFGNFFEKKIKILGNPVIIGDIISKSRIAERNESFDVLFLGRLTIQKNPERFLEIMNKVKLHIPSFTVGMIGNGEMYELVKQKIKELNLEDTVSMLGFISNPYGVLRNSKILCMPSSWEGFGLVAIEALALGKPVVAADVGGLPGIINSESGKLCNATEEYVDEICSLLSNKHYYETKSLNALKQSEKLDNSYQYFADLITIYLTYV